MCCWDTYYIINKEFRLRNGTAEDLQDNCSDTVRDGCFAGISSVSGFTSYILLFRRSTYDPEISFIYVYLHLEVTITPANKH